MRHARVLFFLFPALLLTSVLAGTSCAVRRGMEREEDGESRPLPSDAWFARQRMSSGEPIPVRARQRALEDWRQREPDKAAAPGVWTPAGPTNIGGRLTSLAIDPHDANHLWAGSAAGGVFETTNGGTTWAAVFDDQPLLPIGALAAHPTDSDIVYAGTGEANGAGYSYDGDGVYRTTDGGATWEHLGLAETRRIGRIAVDPVDPQRVFVAAAGGVYTPDGFRGVYRSVNGGTSWTRVLFVAPTAGAIDVAIDPGTPNRIYAAIWEHYSTPVDWVAGGVNSGIWQSTNGGDTWTRLSNGLPAVGPTVGRIGLAIAASNPATVYAVIFNDPGALIGVYKTNNAGVAWVRIDNPADGHTSIFGGFGYYFGQIRVDPANANTVYLLGVSWARSTNGGVNYTTFGSGLHVDHHDLLIRPGKLYMANDGGFYTSTNGGSSWTMAPALPISQFYDLGIDPTNPLKRFGGLQDNGSVRTLTGGVNWTSINGGDGFHCEVDPVDPLFVYCESQYGNIVRSTNGNNGFQNATDGIPSSDRTNWNAPITHDPLTSERLYTGTYRVFRSTNGAEDWIPISGDLTDGEPPHDHAQVPEGAEAHLASAVEGTITAIAVSGVDTNVLWVGTDDGNVWVTTNGGTPWTQVDVPGRTEWVTRLEADPFAAGTAYVTFSGYRNGSRLPRLHRTVDFGASWTEIGDGLPDLPLNCVNADPQPAMRGRLFVCTDVGVHVTDDYGQSWSELGSGMPPVVVHDLDLVDSSRQLFAGTHARSMYVYDLDQLGPADADGDGADNLADCGPDDPGAFAVPGEVTGVLLAADKVTLSWNPAGPAAGSGTEHQLVRGVTGELPAGGGASETCLVPGTQGTEAKDGDVPQSGEAYWYLVRAQNSCGTGGYGLTSDGTRRVSAACP